MSDLPRIAIVGAGPGGLTLARILHLRGHEPIVFEADRSTQMRPQGGTLDLDPDSGQFALQQAGLLEEFRRRARYEDQGMRFLDKSAKVRFEESDQTENDRHEIDRSEKDRRQLRSAALASSVRDGAYSKVQDITALPDGTYRLVLQNITVALSIWWWERMEAGRECALRCPLICRQYTGITLIEFGVDEIDRRYPELSQLVGRGTMGAYGDAKGLIAQRNANAHIRVYAAMRVPRGLGGKELRSRGCQRHSCSLLVLFRDWSPRLQDLIRVSNNHFWRRPLYVLPVGHRWTTRKGMTLLGDAAHVMSPFGGSGVNNALRDATELARCLTEQNSGRREYELLLPCRTGKTKLSLRHSKRYLHRRMR